MKKSTVALILVILCLGGYFALDSKMTRNLFFGLFSEDLKIVRETSLSFMEDIKFKDFVKAATYHSPKDQESVDIPKLIERIFKVKPEFLDIIDYEILDTSIDSSGNRARVKLQSRIHLLNSDKIETPELILYYHKKSGRWYMELESSLR